MKRVVLVGSAQFDESYSELIDSHDIVIRLNNQIFNLQEFENIVGKKTDILIFRSDNAIEEGLKKYPSKIKNLDIAKEIIYFCSENTTVEKKEFKKHREKFKKNNFKFKKDKNFSTGIMAVYYIIDNVINDGDEFNIIGFDFSSTDCYYLKNSYISPFHNFDEECEIINSLLKDGKITNHFSCNKINNDYKNKIPEEIGAFYYAWYVKDNWKDLTIRSNIGRPELGWYNSFDYKVIKKHFDMAEKSNIDFFILSYSGEELENIAYEFMCNEANENKKVNIVPHLELTNALGNPVPNNKKTLKWLIDAIDYFFDLDLSYPNALKKIDDKIVIYIYASRRLKGSLYELDFLRKYVYRKYKKELFLVGDEIWWEIKDKNMHNIIKKRSEKLDAIYSYSLLVPYKDFNNNSYVGREYLDFIEPIYNWFYKNTSVCIYPSIKPRYNDSLVREGNYSIPPEEGSFFIKYYNMIKKYFKGPTNTLLIVSWNEWYEDTQIEPFTSEGKNIEFYDENTNYKDLYLDIIKRLKKNQGR